MGKHSSAAPAQTPAESMAYRQAQPYLAEYNSGQLNATDQAAVNAGNTNKTGSVLQQFASQGMGGSSSLANLVGVVKPGNATQGMQAGAGSAIDLQQLSATQGLLQNDLQTGMAYLGISSGQAEDLAGVQQAQSAALAQALGTVAQGVGSIMSGVDSQPAGVNMDAAVGRYAESAPTATSIVSDDTEQAAYLNNPFSDINTPTA